MKLRWGFWGRGAACVACCAPLVLPWLAGAGLLGLSAGGAGAVFFRLGLEQILCYGVPVLGLAALLVMWLRRTIVKRRVCACQTSCDVACRT